MFPSVFGIIRRRGEPVSKPQRALALSRQGAESGRWPRKSQRHTDDHGNREVN